MSRVSIHDIASEFERLFPEDVDSEVSGNGQQEAGYVGHEPRDDGAPATVGWYCAGGNAGHPVCEIPPASVGLVWEQMCQMSSVDDDVIRHTIEAAGGEWVV